MKALQMLDKSAKFALGTVGTLAFHVHRVPGVKHVMNAVGKTVTYIDDGVAQGWRKTAIRVGMAPFVRVIDSMISTVDATGEVPSVDTLVEICRSQGLPEEQIEMFRKVAQNAREKALKAHAKKAKTNTQGVIGIASA